jgi:enolase
MAKITQIVAREIIDSRANPTIETKIILDDGAIGIASVPSGASVGQHEAIELRDGDPNRFLGMGVSKAVNHVNAILGTGLIGVDPMLQLDIDRWMIKVDGTPNKSKFGANAILSISIALATASSASLHIPPYLYIHDLFNKLGAKSTIARVPSPLFNVINGGKHGAGNLDFQEFHLIPSSAKQFSESYRIGVELYHGVKKVLIAKNAIHSVGDEGGFAPDLYTNLDALEILIQAVKESHYQFGEDVFIGLDIAATNFYKKDKYKIRDKAQPMTREQYIDFIVDLNNQYHLLLLEDPLSEDDWDGWKLLMKKIGGSVVMVGDDLLVTNIEKLKKAVKEQSASAILVKPNQIGTLTETLEVIKFAKENNFKTITSHRSGETTDSFIADFAVGAQTDYVKFGAPARGERVVKYNRLLDIEGELINK